jgi:hypothetical protein
MLYSFFAAADGRQAGARGAASLAVALGGLRPRVPAAAGQVPAVPPAASCLAADRRHLPRHREAGGTGGTHQQALPQGDGLASQTGGGQGDINSC